MPRSSALPMPPVATPRVRNHSDRKQRQHRSEKDFFAMNTYRIAMMEVWEKHNDLSKSRPFAILVSSNLALSAQKFAGKRRLAKLESIFSHKLLCNAVVSEISRKFVEGGPGPQASPALEAYFEENKCHFSRAQERAASTFEILNTLIYNNTELKNREAVQDLVSMPLFRETLEELDRTLVDQMFYREGVGSQRDRVLRMIKSLFKALGPKILTELIKLKIIEKTLSTPFEDKTSEKTRTELRKILSAAVQAEQNSGTRNHEPRQDHQRQSSHATQGTHTPSTMGSGSHSAHQLNGGPKPETTVATQPTKVKPPVVYCHSIMDPELTAAQRQARKDLSYFIFKDPHFQALMTPYFDLSPEPNFYQTYVDRTFLNKEHVPANFEQVVTYFPNYALLKDLVHKTLPTREDLDKSSFVLSTLFRPSEITRPPTFEDYIDRIIGMVDSQSRDFLPFLISEDSYLRHIVSEICARKMVVININKTEVRCQSVSSPDDAFFAPIPAAMKSNPRVLFHVYLAHKAYTSNLELALISLNNHYFTQCLGLNMDTLVRLTAFTKFLLGDKVYLVYDHRVPTEVIFRETMRAFGEPIDENDSRVKEQYKEFADRLKVSTRIDVNTYFPKKNEPRTGSYQENFFDHLRKTPVKEPETPRVGNFLLEGSKDNLPRMEAAASAAGARFTPILSRSNRFDFKRMQSFKKMMKIGVLI